MPKRNKTNICNKDDFKDLINKELIEQLDEKKCELILDLQKFNNNCYENKLFAFRFQLYTSIRIKK